MAEEFKIEVFKRELLKKSDMKALRKNNNIPGVFYSFDSNDSIPLYIGKESFVKAQKSGAKIFNISVGKENKNIIFKSIQYHPVTDEVLHLDLYGVDMKRVVLVSVKINLVGTPKGVQEEGGILIQSLNEIAIECLPLDIPDFIEVDVADLAMYDSIKLDQISIDEKLTLKTDSSQTVASVTHAMKEEEIISVSEEETDEEFIEGEEGDSGDEESTDGTPKDDSSGENKESKDKQDE